MMQIGMVMFIVCFIAALLTIYSGFGLGTILTPFFCIFFPIEIAIAFTAFVHLINSIYKASLTWKNIDMHIVMKFGITSALFAILGAIVLLQLIDLSAITTYSLFNRTYTLYYHKIIIGMVLMLFVWIELVQKSIKFPLMHNLYIGGIFSGFFGGLSGHQGALRSVYLTQHITEKNTLIACSSIIACMVDISRLGIYSAQILTLLRGQQSIVFALIALFGAILGSSLGLKYLQKITISFIQ